MDGIIFDVDGTLWDTREVVAKAWNTALKENSNTDIVITEELLKPLFGKPVNEITDIIFPEISETERRRIEQILYEYENEFLIDHPGKLFDGISKTVKTLAQRYPLFIVSNCQCGYIEVFLKTMHLEPYFKGHLCFGDTGWSKGRNIRYVADQNGLKNPVYIGDMQGDGDAAKEAGVPIVYARYGFGTIEKPDYCIDQPQELIKLFL
jgi:phosphoglycolate phosphatase